MGIETSSAPETVGHEFWEAVKAWQEGNWVRPTSEHQPEQSWITTKTDLMASYSSWWTNANWEIRWNSGQAPKLWDAWVDEKGTLWSSNPEGKTGANFRKAKVSEVTWIK